QRDEDDRCEGTAARAGQIRARPSFGHPAKARRKQNRDGHHADQQCRKPELKWHFAWLGYRNRSRLEMPNPRFSSSAVTVTHYSTRSCASASSRSSRCMWRRVVAMLACPELRWKVESGE